MASFKLGSTSTGGKVTTAGTGCAVVFGIVFMLMGGLFAAFVAKQFLKTVGTYSWEEVPATLGKAEVGVERDKEKPFWLDVEFGYRFGERDYTSTTYTHNKTTDDRYEKLSLKAKSLREAPDLVAYVDPDAPDTAILSRGSLWSGLLILAPLLFVAIGATIAFAAIRAGRKLKRMASGATESISSQATNSKAGAWIGIIIGLMFAGVGVGMIYPLGVKPLVMAKSAKSWPAAPCEIIWAKVKTHKGDDSTTYSVDIFYSYQFNGEQHRSNNYTFSSASSSGRSSKEEIAKSYREAPAPVCYVDPALPERAVLKRDLGITALIGLVPLAFLLIGVPLAIWSFRSWRSDSKTEGQGSAVSNNPFAQNEAAPDTAAKTLSPGKSRFVGTIVLLFVALFWNGIVFGFLIPEAWFEGGDGGMFLKLFSIPFVLVGLGIAAGFFYSLLAVFNPKLVLTVDPGEVRLGESAKLNWVMKGSASRLRRLRIVIRGTEKATYRRGTDTVTVDEVFCAAVLAEPGSAMAMSQGSVEFQVPSDLMHSFDDANNKIVWQLEVRGDVPFWPDINDKFDLTVHPHALPPQS